MSTMAADKAFVLARYPRAFHYRTTRKHYVVMAVAQGMCLGEGKLVAGAWANAAALLRVGSEAKQ